MEEALKWFSETSSEFRAAVFGALVGGLVSGIISFVLQLFAARQTRKERQEASHEKRTTHAQTAVIRLVRMTSDLVKANQHFEEANARREGDTLLWQTLLPLPNIPRELTFTDDEIAVLAHLKKADLAFDLLDCESSHQSMLAIQREYKAQREDLAIDCQRTYQ